MSKIQFYRSRMAVAVAPTLLSGWIRRAVLVLTISLGSLGISSQLVIAQQPQVTGQWETLPYRMPINPIRIALMHTGKVLIVAGSENDPRNLFKSSKLGVWNPVTGSISVQQVSWDVFCNGGSFLADGKCMIVGGTAKYDPFLGDQRVALFDPLTERPFNVQNMKHGRWYASAVTLNDGRVMVFSGNSETGAVNRAVEIYTEGMGWSPEYVAPFAPPLYPWLDLLPSGEVFYSGNESPSRFFNPATKTWRNGPSAINGHRPSGNSVLLPMLPENHWVTRVMILGGGTASTETIDLSAGTGWKFTGNMSGVRCQGSSVLLPDGKVLACGGSAVNENPATATLSADLYDPATGKWSSAGRTAYAHLYHSTALLLPDGRVALMGSNPTRGVFDSHIEMYSPPYLFKGARPVISSAPARIAYNPKGGVTHWTILTPNAAGTTLPDVSAVRLVRPGSPTHAFDMEQRVIGLRFTAGFGMLTVDSSDSTHLPPGYYMLFILNKAGVPSVASFVQVP
ncbi:MAG TPA: galactose oxidase-like domain-containing protein [Chthoniobacterales bacterium]|jgi:hypothetical protein|nr:galactose oxidase-like domain-containing protein [Chthoniobacterales bacterium]